MGFAIEVKNDFNSNLIDENYKNYRFVSKSSVLAKDQYTSGRTPFAYFGIRVYGNNPVLAVRAQNGYAAAIFSVYYDAPNSSYVFDGAAWEGPCTVEYWVFDTVPDQTQGGYVEMFDTSSRLVFSDAFNYLILTDLGYQGTRSYPYSSGTREACIFSTPNIKQFGSPGGFSNQSLVAFSEVNGSISYNLFSLGTTDTSDSGNNSDTPPTYDYPDITLLVDVTGY